MSVEKYTNSSLFSETDKKELKKSLKNWTGFKPHYLPFYMTALTHCSVREQTINNNERLEYLGDALLSVVVGEYLFKKYPLENEGFLTQMRSKIVSRKSLDEIARKMGIKQFLKFNQNQHFLNRSHIFGNALEALIGAVYLDLGFKKTKTFLINHFLDPYINMDALEDKELNFKNKLYTWAQKNQIELDFVTLSEYYEGHRKVFTRGVMANKKELAQAKGFSKKEAGQRAAEIALQKLEEK